MDPSSALPRAAHVGVVGTGLIGGSIARRCQRDGRAVTVLDVDPDAGERARAAGLTVAADLAELVAVCDVVFVCTPPSAVAEVWDRVRRLAAPRATGPLVTDVASVKGGILARLPAEPVASPAALLLSHPMAGREVGGFAASSPTLFDEATWLVCPRRPLAREQLLRLCGTVAALGARPCLMSPQLHDRFCAVVSHLPHVVAFALQRLLARHQGEVAWAGLAGGSLQDVLRVAAADPGLWGEILADNETSLRPLVTELSAEMAAVLAEGPTAGQGAAASAGEATVTLPPAGALTAEEEAALVDTGRRGLRLTAVEPAGAGDGVVLRFAE